MYITPQTAHSVSSTPVRLLKNLGDNASTYGLATLANSEVHALHSLARHRNVRRSKTSRREEQRKDNQEHLHTRQKAESETHLYLHVRVHMFRGVKCRVPQAYACQKIEFVITLGNICCRSSGHTRRLVRPYQRCSTRRYFSTKIPCQPVQSTLSEYRTNSSIVCCPCFDPLSFQNFCFKRMTFLDRYPLEDTFSQHILKQCAALLTYEDVLIDMIVMSRIVT